jgi:hypothetical protein
LNALMPTRVTDLFGRVLGSNRVLLSADHTIRGAYEQRMAQTEAGTYAGPAAAKAQPAQTGSETAPAQPERVTETV